MVLTANLHSSNFALFSQMQFRTFVEVFIFAMHAVAVVVVVIAIFVVIVTTLGRLISAMLCLHHQLPLLYAVAHRQTHTHTHINTYTYMYIPTCTYVQV